MGPELTCSILQLRLAQQLQQILLRGAQLLRTSACCGRRAALPQCQGLHMLTDWLHCIVWVYCGDAAACKRNYQHCWLKHLVRGHTIATLA